MVGGGIERFSGWGVAKRRPQSEREVSERRHGQLMKGHLAIGSLEGRLETPASPGVHAFGIRDSITNRLILCECDRETHDVAIGLHDMRVSASGMIRYDANGEAISMRAEEVHVIGAKPLPQPDDIIGLFASHKIDADEWSEYVREGW